MKNSSSSLSGNALQKTGSFSAAEEAQINAIRPTIKALAKAHIVRILQQKLKDSADASASFDYRDILALPEAKHLLSFPKEVVAWAWRLESTDIYQSLPIANGRGGYKTDFSRFRITLRPWNARDTHEQILAIASIALMGLLLVLLVFKFLV